MTFTLCRLRFVELYRQIVDKMQSSEGYSFVAGMDAKISRHLQELPSYFSSNMNAGGNVKGLEFTLASIMGETRRLRLHRPFLFKGYKDRKYVSGFQSRCCINLTQCPRQVQSREQCVKSAEAILFYLKSDDEKSAILLKWWIVLFYGFAAASPSSPSICNANCLQGCRVIH